MPVVSVPGLGNVQFPDDLDKAEMSKIIERHLNRPKGLIEEGNLDLNNRPFVFNQDGSVSSEYSTSFGDEHGREVLVPTIVNGKFLTPNGKKPKEGSKEEKEMFKQAQRHYEKTGEHLGIFDKPENADVYAVTVHNRPQLPRNETHKPMFVYQTDQSKSPPKMPELEPQVRMNMDNYYEDDLGTPTRLIPLAHGGLEPDPMVPREQ